MNSEKLEGVRAVTRHLVALARAAVGRGVGRAVVVLGFMAVVGGVWAQDANEPGMVEDTLRLTLQGAQELALQRNDALRAKQLGAERAQRATQEKWGGLLPTLSASGNYSRYLKKPVIFLPQGSPIGPVLEIGSDNSYQGAVQAHLPLFAMPVYRGVQMGKIDQAIAEEDVRGTRLGIVGQVRLAFINLLLAHDSRDVMEESMARAETTLRNVEQLKAQGMVSEYDLLRARVQVGNLQPMLIQARQGVELAEMGLRALIGVAEEVQLLPLGSLDDLAEGLAPRVSTADTSMGSSSQIRMLELQEQKMHKQYELIRDSRWPVLAAFANYQVQTQANDFKFDDYRWVQTAVVGLQVSVPLFTGLTKLRQEQQVRLGAREVALQRSYAVQQVAIKVRMARQQMVAAHESMVAQRAAVELAARGREIASARYAAGAGNLLELNDAELALTQARLGYNQSIYAYVKAYVEYAMARGEE